MATHDRQFSMPMRDTDGRVRRVFIDCFGGDTFKIVVREKLYYFSWSEMFGPLAETKTGRVRDLRHNDPFWRAASLWNLQGQRLDGANAIWHEPRKPVYRIEGRQIVEVIDEGEPGHDW